MNNKALCGIAVFSAFLSLFPFVVLTEAIAFGSYTWWHYFALYAVHAVFYLCGYFCRSWVIGGSFSKRFKPVAFFLSRAAVAVLVITFVVVCVWLKMTAGLFLYTLPAAIIAYFFGYNAFGKGYTDLFSRGMFAMFFVAAVITSALLWFTHDDVILSDGMYQLCVGFGILIIAVALVTNQTNIDMRTGQRSAGKAVLPNGLRSYNAMLIAVVGAAIVGLCLFSGPLAMLIMGGIKQLLSLVLSLFRERDIEDPTYQHDEGYQQGEYIDIEENSGSELLNLLLVIILVVVIIRFRRQIWSFIKSLAAPLFKVSEPEESMPFYDEVADSAAKYRSKNPRREIKQLYKRYCRENDAVTRYRLGYTLFLTKLSQSPYSQAISDTTYIHGVKGNNAFHRDSLDEMVAVYNKVRYGGYSPAEEELEAQKQLIDEIL